VSQTNQISRFVAWDHLQDRIDKNLPFNEPLPGSPGVNFFFDAGRREIGLELQDSGVDNPELNSTVITLIRGTPQNPGCIQLRSNNEELFREFYDFACQIADRYQIEKKSAKTSIDLTWAAWTRLLNRQALLDNDQQVGLLGELWLLEEISNKYDFKTALDAWHDESTAEHDFALTTVDIEVKTTLAENRIHIIGSSTQLDPIPGRDLYLLSVQYTPAPPGAFNADSLSSRIDHLRTIARIENCEERLTSRLRILGWHSDDSSRYGRQFILRSHPALVKVDDNCPRLTRTDLESARPANLGRLVSLDYRINVDGLGDLYGSQAFDNRLQIGHIENGDQK
jgi:Putative  PD-(D/E)XK family member, (DUF4420)